MASRKVLWGCLTLVLLPIPVLVIAGIVLNARGCSRPGLATRPGTVEVPPLGQRSVDVVDAVDFAVEDGRFLHLVWHTTVRPDDVTRQGQVWYRRVDLVTGACTPPAELITDGGAPRIVQVGHDLHVIVPYYLRHFVSGDHGATWKEAPRVIDDSAYIAQQFDVGAAGDSLVVAYLSPKREAWEGHSLGPERLWVTTCWGSERRTAIAPGLAEPKGLREPPYLVVDGSTAQLYAIVNRLYEDQDTIQIANRRVPQGRSVGTIYHWSRDGSGAWSPPDSSGWPAEVYQPPNGSTVYEYAATSIGPRKILFAGNWALHCVQSAEDGEPYRSHSVAEADDRWFSADRQAKSISVAHQAGSGQVVWIDTRFGRTDKTPLNPLGGFPWSDTPDWPNNDVLAYPLGDALEGRIHDPVRLTREMSFTKCVRAHATAGKIYVAWAGYPKIDRNGDGDGRPMAIYYTTLPPQ